MLNILQSEHINAGHDLIRVLKNPYFQECTDLSLINEVLRSGEKDLTVLEINGVARSLVPSDAKLEILNEPLDSKSVDPNKNYVIWNGTRWTYIRDQLVSRVWWPANRFDPRYSHNYFTVGSVNSSYIMWLQELFQYKLRLRSVPEFNIVVKRLS